MLNIAKTAVPQQVTNGFLAQNFVCPKHIPDDLIQAFEEGGIKDVIDDYGILNVADMLQIVSEPIIDADEIAKDEYLLSHFMEMYTKIGTASKNPETFKQFIAKCCEYRPQTALPVYIMFTVACQLPETQQFVDIKPIDDVALQKEAFLACFYEQSKDYYHNYGSYAVKAIDGKSIADVAFEEMQHLNPHVLPYYASWYQHNPELLKHLIQTTWGYDMDYEDEFAFYVVMGGNFLHNHAPSIFNK